MVMLTKKAVKAGNSSAIVLPKSWLNKEVRVELVKKSDEEILRDIIDIANKFVEIDKIIGIYLVGSYAREEETNSSDIDIMVVTKDIDKSMINEGIYSILIVSQELVNQKLENDLFPIGQMIREAKPLINSWYLENIDVRVTGKNVKWYLDTTQEKLDIIGKAILKADKKGINSLSDGVAYTLVLRIRTLEIIRKLILNEKYSNKDFINRISKITGNSNAYERYIAVKKGLKDENGISLEETKKLYDYLNSEYKKVGEMVKKLGRVK